MQETINTNEENVKVIPTPTVQYILLWNVTYTVHDHY